MSRNATLALIGIALAAAGVPGANADELVLNGGFEAGSLADWTEFGDVSHSGVWPLLPHSGGFSAFFGPVEPGGGIQQTLVAAAGDQINISFWYVSEQAGTPNSLVVTIGNQTLLNLSDVTATSYQHFTATVTVSAANPILRFTLVNGGDYFDLDDISADRTLLHPPCHGVCVADFDNGSGTGTPDGGVGIEDLLYYLSLYNAGVSCADVDDGSGTGTPDGGVGIEDLLYFLARYNAGC